MSEEKFVLQVIMLDTLRSDIAVRELNECMPFGRRLVTIELTDEQMKQIQPRYLGENCHTVYYEEFGDVWIEEK